MLYFSGTILVTKEASPLRGNMNKYMDTLLKSSLFSSITADDVDSVLDVSVYAEAASSVLFLNVQKMLTTCPVTCGRHNQMIRNLLCDLAGKNLRLGEKSKHMSQKTTRDKLLSYLSSEMHRHGSNEFDIPFSRQQLADFLSVDRSGLSTELGRMKTDGLIDFHKSHFVLKSPAQGWTDV